MRRSEQLGGFTGGEKLTKPSNPYHTDNRRFGVWGAVTGAVALLTAFLTGAASSLVRKTDTLDH
jgi:hypothetical protein